MNSAVSLLLTLLLLAGATPAAGQEAVYPDLPTNHWAYGDMTRAVELGGIAPDPDGNMRPDAPITWAEHLHLLARICYPDTLAASDFDGAKASHVLGSPDFLPVSALSLDGALTRQEGAVLADRVLRQVYGKPLLRPTAGDMSFSDWNTLAEPYRGAALQCSARGLVGGLPDGSFGGTKPLTRAAAVSLTLRTAAMGKAAAPADPGDPFAPGVTSGLTALGENAEKRQRLFGDPSRRRFTSEADAKTHMVQITVPVWSLNRTSGVKKPGTLTFITHSALAAELTDIFTEIYSDPEQFPIYGIEGYTWRGNSATGEHNCGSAIDLNYKENYQVYDDGRVGAGEFWSPGSDPFSLPPEGSVVRIFAAHGFSWGGTAWSGSKDYMHFSYLGG
ncbi:MAG: S-layer homology domain-containing protein [Pseudoflavonifractor sp.]